MRKTQAQVRARLGPEPREVLEYRKAHDRELGRRFQLATKSELLTEISQAEIFFGGDFHALGQAQRTHLRILRSLDLSRPLVLALEAFPHTCQEQLDQFMSGQLSIDRLPEAVNWEKIWGFPFENYRPILEFAFKHRIRLIALNDLGRTLKQRDRLAAKILERELNPTSDPGRKPNQPSTHQTKYVQSKNSHAKNGEVRPLVYVIFGELHLAHAHLPLALEKSLGRPVKSVTLYINSSRIYFQLARQDLEQTTDLVKLGRGLYCALTSPPWVQWQSYLLFLEQTGDLDLSRWDEVDEDEFDEDEFESEPDFDPTDHVTAITKILAADFKMNIKQLKFGDLSVYGSSDERLWRYLKKSLNKRDQALVQELISNHRSFLIPSEGIGYMAHPTVNHAAYLAGQYLHSKLISRARPIWDFPQDFHALIWQEAVGFFASKMINHKRVAESLHDLQAQFLLAGAAQKDILKLVLDQRMSELIFLQEGRRRPLKFKPRRRSSYLEAARILGGMLGERLYLAMRSRKLSLSELLSLLRLDVEAKPAAFNKRIGINRPKKSQPDFSRNGFEHILLFLQKKLGKQGASALERSKSKKERL